MGKRKERSKDLKALIEEVAGHLPHLHEPMDMLRIEGNECMHPKKKPASKERLFQRRDLARNCAETLTAVVEETYLPA